MADAALDTATLLPEKPISAIVTQTDGAEATVLNTTPAANAETITPPASPLAEGMFALQEALAQMPTLKDLPLYQNRRSLAELDAQLKDLVAVDESSPTAERKTNAATFLAEMDIAPDNEGVAANTLKIIAEKIQAIAASPEASQLFLEQIALTPSNAEEQITALERGLVTSKSNVMEALENATALLQSQQNVQAPSGETPPSPDVAEVTPPSAAFKHLLAEKMSEAILAGMSPQEAVETVKPLQEANLTIQQQIDNAAQANAAETGQHTCAGAGCMTCGELSKPTAGNGGFVARAKAKAQAPSTHALG
jgi:hypothetical protein